MNNESELESLLAYCQADGRVCPLPNIWNNLWKLIKRTTGKEDIPAPLILAAWYDTPILPKMLRLREHVEIAYENGAFDQVKTFLMSLEEGDWYHLTDD
jgi:hypothetical protein